jgi:hypothetical protein
MSFTLNDFDAWASQVVFYGSTLILEAVRGDETPSIILLPMTDTRVEAHRLISNPSCSPKVGERLSSRTC